jgi:hypothetical protein
MGLLIESLPTEVWFLILDKLPISDVVSLEESCKHFRNMINTEETWNFFKNRRFRKRRKVTPTAKQAFIDRYEIIDWWDETHVIGYQMAEVLEKYNSFEFQLPDEYETEEIVMNTLTNDNFSEDLGFSLENSQASFLHKASKHRYVNFTAIMFFARFKPSAIRPFLFKKVECWWSNTLISILLYAVDSQHSRQVKAILKELIPLYREQILAYVIR